MSAPLPTSDFRLPTPRTYAILGTGALGGFYGARLQQAGCEVHFLLRSDYEQVQQHGLVVESIDGDFTLPQVKAYQTVQEMPTCDVVVVALKTTQNHLLPELLPPIVKPTSVVLVLQNGWGIETQVAELVGSDRVMGGLCFLCSNKVGPGHIRHLDYGQITLADYAADYAPCGITDRLKQIASDFEQAGIAIELAEDLLIARWKKLMWNIPFNGLSVVLNATTDAMMAHPQTRSLAKSLMQEVQAGCTACARFLSGSDRSISSDFIDTMLDYTAKMKPYRTSMKIDYDAGQPLEVESIVGNPLRMAQQAGLELPQMTMLYQQLTFLAAQQSS
jgi:2-dehydropantoate 2-reductase